eukprot:ANDGO_00605.mRNA.1 hypothetical protein
MSSSLVPERSREFFSSLRSVFRSLETSSRDLRKEIESVPPSIPKKQQEGLVARLGYSVADLKQSDALLDCEAIVRSSVPFGDVVAICTAMLEANDRGISVVEDAMQEYGRTKHQHSSYENLWHRYMRERQAEMEEEARRTERERRSHRAMKRGGTAQDGAEHPSSTSSMSFTLAGSGSGSGSMNGASHSGRPTTEQQLPHHQPQQLGTGQWASVASTPPARARHEVLHDDDLGRTPTLEDYGLSAATLGMIAQTKSAHPDVSSHINGNSTSNSTSNSFSSMLSSPISKFSLSPIPAVHRQGPLMSSHAGAPATNGPSTDPVIPRKPDAPSSVAAAVGPCTGSGAAISAISAEEYASAPIYLRTQVPLDMLNSIAESINAFVRASGHRGPAEDGVHVTQKDLEDVLEIGPKTKAVILLLRHFKKFGQKRIGNETVYTLEESHSRKT